MNAGMRTGGCLGRFGREGDPRSRRGRRYPLSGLLGMLILAALHGEKSLRGMWMWGCKHWARIRHPLGFVGNPRPPAYTTVWYVVTALDGDALDEALGEWALSWSVERLRSISVDGKVLRGSRRTNPQQPALEVLTAAAHELKVVLGQRGVPDGDLVAAAVALLQGMPLKGRLVTADAGLLCRPVVDTILEVGGDYLGVVKDNQPELKKAVDDWVEPDVFPLGQGASAG
jgi:hypothetical protein